MNTNGLADLRAAMRDCIVQIMRYKDNPVTIFHHNDTDGITSASVLSLALKRAGLIINRRVSLEKPYLPVLKRILEDPKVDGVKETIIFTDICGRIADLISDLNAGKRLVVILDHHIASHPRKAGTFNLDCDLYGIRGDLHMSASTTCFMFAEELLHAEADDLAALGVLGAIGDGFYENGKLSGFNKTCFLKAEKQGQISFQNDVYVNGKGESLTEVARALDTAGAVGYYENGAEEAVLFLITNGHHTELSINTTDNAFFVRVSALMRQREEKFAAVRKNAEKFTKQKGNVLSVDICDMLSPMGVKMIGILLTEMASEIKEPMYLIGMQDVPPELPVAGYGPISDSPQKKVSARVSKHLDEEIRRGKAIPLDFLLPNAASRVGGFSDACHPTAAAVVIDANRGGDFLDSVQNILRGGSGVGFGRGFGKTILCGGDCGFLMWGVKGIVGALPYETICLVEPANPGTVEPGESFVVSDKRPDVPGYKEKKQVMSKGAIRNVIEHLGLSERIAAHPIAITYRGSLLAASGDGASAAFCVSLARALNHAYALNQDEAGINRAGWMGEHSFHGKPSGVDNTVSTYGGLIEIDFNLETKQNNFRQLDVKPVEIVLAHSGITADTSSLLGICQNMRNNNTELFDSQIDRIKASVAEMGRLFQEGNLEALGRAMCANHRTIKEMGLSHEKVDRLCEIAMKEGALGAKVTGGGLGGYVLCLTPGKELQSRVRAAMEEAGAKAILAVKWPHLS